MSNTIAIAEPVRNREPGFVEFTILCAAMMGVTAFAVDAVLPAFPEIGAAFRVDEPNRLQLVVYVYMLGFGLAQIVYGPISDIVGRRRTYLVGVAIFLVGCLVAALADNLATLLVARFIQGVGAAPGRVLSTAIIRDRYSGRDMARVLSLNMTVFITVPVFAPAVGGLIVAVFPWHGLFVAMLGLGIGIGIWFWWRMPETLAPANTMPPSLGRVAQGFGLTARSRVAVGYASATALLFGCVMTLVGSSQQIFAGTYGLGAWFPLAFAVLAGSMGAAGFLNSALVVRYGMRRISHASIAGLVLLGFVQVAGSALAGGHPSLVFFGIVLAASQFLLGLAFPNLNAIAMEPLAKVAGTAASLIGVYTTVVGALCGLVIGASFDGTVMPLALGYLGLSVLALAIIAVTERGQLLLPRRAVARD